ncbi:MAG: hypothetical protein GY856_04000, partial [bacterium]|nr:hypothetical protein [bacterium]
MSAADTALRVVRWALVAAPGVPPPHGLPLAPETLQQPPAELREALAELAAVTSARLRLGNPPLDEDRAPGLDALVLALAIATTQLPGGFSEALLGGLPPTGNAWEWVVRHALTLPALPYLHPDLADELRARSPLTA